VVAAGASDAVFLLQAAANGSTEIRANTARALGRFMWIFPV
jgi:hypothetical protein